MRLTSESNRQRREVLRSMDGRQVTLGVGKTGGTPTSGKLVLGRSAVRFVTVTLVRDDGPARAVPLGDIRWVKDPQSGKTMGGS